ncbi:MAG: hypothetical protein HYU64_20290 [Armatimonadetes bacterium]|nr:hypothetical protein [Armatimonadota bacterium]
MGELDDCLDRLRRPFPVERRMGFQNMSVMGGFHRYVLQWAKKVMTAASDDRLASDLDHLCTLFLHYDEAALPERRRLLDRGEEILGSLKPPPENTTTIPAPVPFQVLPEKKPARQERPNTTTLESPVQYAKGVGPALSGKLERLSIQVVEDLFLHFPRRHEDRRRLSFLRDVQDGTWVTVSATVQGVSDVRPRGGLVITKVAVSDGTANAFLVWYNQPHIKKRFKRGMTIVASGKADRRFREIQIQTPECEILDGTDSLHTGRIVPIYPLTENLSQTTLRRIIKENLERHGERIQENLPDDLTASHRLLNRTDAFRAIHFPSSWEELEKARFRLVFEEFFFLQVIMALKAKVALKHKRPRKYGLTGDPIEKFQEKLPFLLTGAQKRVMKEILADFSEDRGVRLCSSHGDSGGLSGGRNGSH